MCLVLAALRLPAHQLKKFVRALLRRYECDHCTYGWVQNAAMRGVWAFRASRLESLNPHESQGFAAVGFRPSCICTRNYPDKREESSVSQIVEGHKRRRRGGCAARAVVLYCWLSIAETIIYRLITVLCAWCVTFELCGSRATQQPGVPISQQPSRRRRRYQQPQPWHACSRCSPRPQLGKHRSS